LYVWDLLLLAIMNNEYIEKMKEWIELDNKSMKLKEDMTEIAELKKELENDILQYVEKQGLEKVTVNVSDGSIKFPKKNALQTISFKYLKSTLEKYNTEQSIIDVPLIYNFLVSNLETKSKLSIKRDVR
jgi:hypothetical protein